MAPTARRSPASGAPTTTTDPFSSVARGLLPLRLRLRLGLARIAGRLARRLAGRLHRAAHGLRGLGAGLRHHVPGPERRIGNLLPAAGSLGRAALLHRLPDALAALDHLALVLERLDGELQHVEVRLEP